MCSSNKTGSVDPALRACLVKGQEQVRVGVGDSPVPFILRAHALDPIARMHILTSLKQLECSFPTCVEDRVILLFQQNILRTIFAVGASDIKSFEKREVNVTLLMFRGIRDGRTSA